MKRDLSSLCARLASGAFTGACVILLTGCISYQRTVATPTPSGRVQLTGSHVEVPGESAKAASLSSAAPVTVYTQDDLERRGASDLAGFLQRVPFARVHR